jgi:DHA1 family bicyclomycin/chloramphenicol resistance-like MFS transporter
VTDDSRSAGRSHRSLALTLGALSAFGPLATDFYLPALPEIARSFETSAGTAQLTLSAAFFGLGIGQTVYGPFSDAQGRRLPLLAGILLFIAAAATAPLAPSIGVLIFLQFVLAFGACAGIVISRAIVRDLFAGTDEAARFYALIMLVFGIAPVLGPLIGGQLLLLGGWEVPYVALAVMGLLCLTAVLWLPETLPRERRRSGGLRDALGSYRYLVRNRAFLPYPLVNCFSGIGLFAFIATSPSIVIDQFGVSPQVFGFVFGLNALGLVAASQIASRQIGRRGSMPILRMALVIQAVAAVILLVVALAGGSLWALLAPLFFVVAPFGAVLPTSTALALTPFPERAGTASALIGALQLAVGAGAGALAGLLGFAAATSLALVVAPASVLAVVVLLLFVPARPSEVTSPRPATETLA